MKITELIMLARVMSQRYGVNVQIAHDLMTASCAAVRSNAPDKHWTFNITLPLLKDKGKFDRMVRGYLDHELGHVQFTDFDFEEGLRVDSTFKQIWNIFEDVYVETKMGAAFPGSKLNLQWLARHLFTRGMARDSIDKALKIRPADVADLYKNINDFVLPYCLFKRRAMLDTELAHSHKMFDSVRDAIAGLHARVAGAFDKIDNALAQPANSSRETYELAKQVYDAIMDIGDLLCQQSQQGGSGQDNENSDGNRQDVIDSGTSLKVFKKIVKAANAAFADSKGKNGGKGGDIKDSDIKVSFTPDVSSAFSSMINTGRGGAECESFGDATTRKMFDVTHDLMKLDREQFDDYKLKCKTADSDIMDSISVLQSGFMRTIPGLLQSIQFMPCRTGYAGRLSGRDLYKAGTGNGKIFLKKAERKEQRVDVALLLDVSGSMRNDVKDAQITMYAMLGMLKKLPKVRSFAVMFSGSRYAIVSRFTDKRINDYRISGAENTTPTAGAILKTLPMFSPGDVRRIMFVITDGDPNSIEAFDLSMKIAREHGVEVYGIGLRIGTYHMAERFGKGYSVSADDIKELPVKLADMMKSALVRAVA